MESYHLTIQVGGIIFSSFRNVVGGSDGNMSDEVGVDMDYSLYFNRLPLVAYLDMTFPSKTYKFVSLVGLVSSKI